MGQGGPIPKPILDKGAEWTGQAIDHLVQKRVEEGRVKSRDEVQQWRAQHILKEARALAYRRQFQFTRVYLQGVLMAMRALRDTWMHRLKIPSAFHDSLKSSKRSQKSISIQIQFLIYHQ